MVRALIAILFYGAAELTHSDHDDFSRVFCAQVLKESTQAIAELVEIPGQLAHGATLICVSVPAS